MDGEGGPQSELRLGEMNSVPDSREKEEGNRIQDEHGSERYSHLFFSRVHYGSDRCDCASTTDGGSRADQERRYALNLAQTSNAETEEHGKAYAESGV